MDDDLQQLEAELKRLRPAAPTRDFLARLEREFAAPGIAVPRRRAASLWWLWAGAGAVVVAGAVVTGVAVANRPHAEVPSYGSVNAR